MDISREGSVLEQEMSADAGHAFQLEFLSKLQRILNEGLFTASYKYALIMALAELSIEKTDRDDGSLYLSFEDIADRFISLCWRQVAPFAGGRDALRFATGHEATAITKIRAFRQQVPTLSAAKKHFGWTGLIRSVSTALINMPFRRLQRVGSEKIDFLYEEVIVASGLVLRPGVAACFRQQFALIQALVQMAWLSFVQRLPANRSILGSTIDLADFLFGSERSALTAIVGGLRDLQNDECFYCSERLYRDFEVDHFIPWSRYPRDLGHNFVLAHGSCNHDKRDMLAAPSHLIRWVERNDSHSPMLQQIFDGARFLHDLDASLTVAQWAYETAENAGALVWLRKRGQTAKLSGGWQHLFIAPKTIT